MWHRDNRDEALEIYINFYWTQNMSWRFSFLLTHCWQPNRFDSAWHSNGCFRQSIFCLALRSSFVHSDDLAQCVTFLVSIVCFSTSIVLLAGLLSRIAYMIYNLFSSLGMVQIWIFCCRRWRTNKCMSHYSSVHFKVQIKAKMTFFRENGPRYVDQILNVNIQRLKKKHRGNIFMEFWMHNFGAVWSS